jgi:hypothetical protein
VKADDLYGLALDRFIGERDAQVRSLRSDGRRDEASEVAALRKPSVAAWAINQLVRTQKRAVTALFKHGDALRDVQSQVLAGTGGAAELRAAGEREREAVNALVDKARGLLSGDGHELGAATLERVSETLHAAALDDDAREQVQAGTLVRELRHVGLGGGAAPQSTAAPPRSKPRPRDDAAKQELVERERARKQAKSAEADARREDDRAQRALKVAHDRYDRAKQALDEAGAKLGEAEQQARAASSGHAAAIKQLEALEA